MSRRSWLFVAVIFATVLSATTALGTVLVERSLEELTAEADLVVHGVVVRSGSQLRLGDGEAEPQTLTRIRVTEWLKGSGDAEVVIRERGGEAQGLSMWISGTPRYTLGEEVVVFLERRPEAPHDLRTHAMVQGKFVVRRGIHVPAAVERDLENVGLARWAEDGTFEVVEAGNEPSMHLETFLDFVRAEVARGGAR
jgi:hypothetical protein